MIWWLLACASPGGDTAAPLPFCEAILQEQPAPSDPDMILDLMTQARAALYPQLEHVEIALVEMDSDTDFFVANLDLATAAEPPFERSYRIQYSRQLFDDPAPHAGVGAILGHELGHIDDYTGMDTEELVSFALWYADGDIAAYERLTDERVLEAGCGLGLGAYRSWLYGRVDAKTEAQKRIDYYTPEEIAAWMAAH